MKKKKILYIHHGWGIGGAPISLLNLIKGLDKELFDVKVIFLRNSDVVELYKKENIEYELLRGFFFEKFYRYFQHTESKSFNLLRIDRWLRAVVSWVLLTLFFGPKVLCKEKFDLVHLNSIVLTDWACAAKRLGKKVVLHVREPLSSGIFGFRNSLIRFILRNYTDGIIAISQDNAKRLKMSDSVTVIYNPFNINFGFLTNINKDNNSVLYIGGEATIKGFDIIKELIDVLPNNIIIKLAGNYSKNFITNKKNVKLLGLLSEEQIYMNLMESTMLLVPNIFPHFSRPVIESYFAKTPVIASKISGMDEIVKDGVTGYLVKPNSNAFSLKILEGLNDLNKLNNMGEAGYKYATKNFSAIQSAIKVQSIYNEIICQETK